MIPVLKFYVGSFTFCFSDVLVLFVFLPFSAGEINKVEKSPVETGKQNILPFLSKDVLKFVCSTVTENPGIKPRNTNVVFKGRHSLLKRWMHGGQFHQTCIPPTFSMQFI